MPKRLIDKVLEAATAVIENQESVPVVVKDWRLIRISSTHQVVVSVMVATKQFIGYEPFDVWVTIDMDTEEVTIKE